MNSPISEIKDRLNFLSTLPKISQRHNIGTKQVLIDYPRKTR